MPLPPPFTLIPALAMTMTTLSTPSSTAPQTGLYPSLRMSGLPVVPSTLRAKRLSMAPTTILYLKKQDTRLSWTRRTWKSTTERTSSWVSSVKVSWTSGWSATSLSTTLSATKLLLISAARISLVCICTQNLMRLWDLDICRSRLWSARSVRHDYQGPGGLEEAWW